MLKRMGERTPPCGTPDFPVIFLITIIKVLRIIA